MVFGVNQEDNAGNFGKVVPPKTASYDAVLGRTLIGEEGDGESKW